VEKAQIKDNKEGNEMNFEKLDLVLLLVCCIGWAFAFLAVLLLADIWPFNKPEREPTIPNEQAKRRAMLHAINKTLK